MSASGPPDDPFGEQNPFRNLPLFGDLARLIGQQGPVSWDAARQLALSVATGGQSEPNVEPLQRMKLEELLRVAELRVADATGLSTSVTGRALSAVPVNRSQWVARSVDAYRELFEELAGSLGRSGLPGGSEGGIQGADDVGTGDASDVDAMGQWLGNLMKMMSPMMLGMTAGSMLGHLARRSLGQYDLPLPRPSSDELLFAVPNIVEFGREWSLDYDDVLLWVCVHEVAHHAVLGVPHVRERLTSLLRRYAAGFEPDPAALEHRLADLSIEDAADMSELQRVLGDPEVLLGAIQSPAQRQLLPELEALVAAIEGYVDWTIDQVGAKLLASFGMLTEALRRRRVTPDPSDRFVQRLLGLELSQRQYERGSRFIDGVVERAGADALDRLWQARRGLPTPAEIDAPGLWLARLELAD